MTEAFHHLVRNGTEISVRVIRRKGRGEQVFFIHGWMHSADRWLDLMRLFPSDADLLSVELPGFGESTIKPTNAASIDLFSDVIEELVASFLKPGRKTSLVAHSLGGLLSLGFSKLVFDRTFYVAVPINGLSGAANLLGFETLSVVGLSLNRMLPRKIETYFTTKSALLTVSDPECVDDLMIRDARRADVRVAARMAREITQFRLHTALPCDKKSSFVVHGENDQIVSETDSAELAEYCCADLTVIPESGHTVMLEATAELYAFIIQSAQCRK